MSAANLVVVTLWAALAASVVARLTRLGAAAFDEHFDERDRRLVSATAAFIVVPAVVLASHVVQVAVWRTLSVGLDPFETWVVWGAVTPALHERPEPALRALVAAIGPGSALAVAAMLVVWTRARRSRAAVNHLRLETARILVLLALGVSPVVSLLAGRGDVWAVRDALNALRPPAGDVALLGYGVLAAWVFFRWRNAHSLRALATPLHDAARRAERRLEQDPDDADARMALAAAQLASGDPRALDTLEEARVRMPGDARVELLLGRALLNRGRARDAAAHLREAGRLFEAQGEHGALLLETILALCAARIALGDGEGALLTAEAARDAAPHDPRTSIALADALVLAGRADDARAELEGALQRASGALWIEIQRRIAALDRREWRRSRR